MLSFAASLAAGRAGAPVADRAVPDRRLRRTARVLLLAPPACVAAVAVAAVVMSLAYARLGALVPWAAAAQLPLCPASPPGRARCSPSSSPAGAGHRTRAGARPVTRLNPPADR
ncbi:hypothetical protein [Micromonospora chersina]|uniref:hypothetical protein n=1 Tax=Micromonospora chersina TaxID=47854 RepID=UPI0037208F89